MADARAQAADPAWKDTYRRWRPPVERGIAWLTAGGNRRLRYLGTLKNDTWLRNRAAALNLRRLVNLGLTPTNGTWTLPLATHDNSGVARHQRNRPTTRSSVIF